MHKEIALDPGAVVAKRLADIDPGSVVSGRTPSGSAFGIVLRDASPAHANRYLLSQDEQSVYVPERLAPYVALLVGPASRLRLLLSEPCVGRPPGRPEDMPGHAGVDTEGAFILFDTRRHGSSPTIGTVCCREWTYGYGTQRALQADLFFECWEIVSIDEFGNRSAVLSGAASKKVI